MPKPKPYKLYNADCREVCTREMEAESIDTVITDPPYGLKFMGKDWDRGVPGVGFWTRIMRVCKPGAILLAFGGTRTFHRLACAIEDAGFELRDTLMWVYGTGFPKSLGVSKAIDKAAGAEREVDAAKLWDGWGTALKPAWEPILLAMKPLDGTYAANAVEHGVAGLNVDGARVGTGGDTQKGSVPVGEGHGIYGAGLHGACEIENIGKGRWPANVILSHHPECVQVGVKKVKKGGGCGEASSNLQNKSGFLKGEATGGFATSHYDADGLETVEDWQCHKDCPVGMLPESDGCHGGGMNRKFSGWKQVGDPKIPHPGKRGDSGSAARFFKCCPLDESEIRRLFYCAKSSKRERNAGLPEEMQNSHPTVKPLALMEYLCKLTMTPTGGVVFDPFMGSGTTGVACANTGRGFVGCENNTEQGYFEIAKQRIRKAYQK